MADMAESFRVESVVRGQHVYKGVWRPRLGEESETLDNEHNRFAVAVSKSGQTIGHQPREISRISWYCLERGTNGSAARSSTKDSALRREVPCIYVFSGKPSHIHKLIDFFFEKLITFIVISLYIFIVYQAFFKASTNIM